MFSYSTARMSCSAIPTVIKVRKKEREKRQVLSNNFDVDYIVYVENNGMISSKNQESFVYSRAFRLSIVN
jgi:hypothetical protein